MKTFVAEINREAVIAFRSEDGEEAFAIHEAGHAVIGRVLTIPCGSASIKSNRYSEGRSTIIADRYECFKEWEKRGKFRADNAPINAMIITAMAGVEAEREIFGHCIEGHGDEDCYYTKKWLESLYDDPDKKEQRLRSWARTLVRRHRVLIERVADKLIAKKTLSARQIDRLVS
jgi:ATP-dependent Zn protease